MVKNQKGWGGEYRSDRVYMEKLYFYFITERSGLEETGVSGTAVKSGAHTAPHRGHARWEGGVQDCLEWISVCGITMCTL